MAQVLEVKGFKKLPLLETTFLVFRRFLLQTPRSKLFKTLPPVQKGKRFQFLKNILCLTRDPL